MSRNFEEWLSNFEDSIASWKYYTDFDKVYNNFLVIAPIIILGFPIFDTLFAIVRRLIKGKSVKAVFQADKGHLHHRLMKRGYTQKQAVFILYGLTATLGMFAIILLESGPWKALSFALLIIAIVAIGYKDIIKENNMNEQKIEENIDEKNIRHDKPWGVSYGWRKNN